MGIILNCSLISIDIYIMGSCLSSSHPEVVLLPLVTSSTAGKSKATTTPIVHWIKRRYACKLELLAEKRGPTTQHVLPSIFLLNSYPSFTIFTICFIKFCGPKFLGCCRSNQVVYSVNHKRKKESCPKNTLVSLESYL